MRYSKQLSALIPLTLLASASIVQNAMHRISAGGTTLVSQPPQFVGLSIDPRIVRRFLGLRLVAADWIWIDTLLKADATREVEPFTGFYRAFKNIVTLDPDNLYAYYVAGMYLSVIKNDIKGASAILREGTEHLESTGYTGSGAWQIYYALGYNLIFEEHDVEAGSEWIRRAAEMPGSTAMIQTLAQHVSTEQGRLEIAARILADLRRRVTRPDEKAQVEKKMTDLAGRQEIADLNEKFQKFLGSTEAYALPKQKAFRFFLRSLGHPGKDLFGRRLGVNALGRIEPQAQ